MPSELHESILCYYKFSNLGSTNTLQMYRNIGFLPKIYIPLSDMAMTIMMMMMECGKRGLERLWKGSGSITTKYG